jgi:hypothetical protein
MSAVVSPCGRYRYVLRREVPDLFATRRTALWVMLNPSTADATADDPTIRRCLDFSRAWGCDRMVVVNLYALRTTDPRRLWDAEDPVGPENDAHIGTAAGLAGLTVCAWGGHAKPERVAQILPLLSAPQCLGRTRGGSPRHPLYLPKVTRLEPFDQ